MERKLKTVRVGGKFIYKGRVYQKCRTTVAQMIPISYQVFVVDTATGNITTMFDQEMVNLIQ